MTKFFALIIILIIYSCQNSNKSEKVNSLNENETLDSSNINKKWSSITLKQLLEIKNDSLKKIILNDINSFAKVPKDTLIVNFQCDDFCGNSPIERIDGSPLFEEIKNRATGFGFKIVLKDTTGILELEPYQNLPIYNLGITANGNKAHISQCYLYMPNGKEIVLFRKNIAIKL